jgi:hypothetical protein
MSGEEIDLDFNSWIAYGINKNFCGPPVCTTHDGIPMTEEESNEFDEGYDPCIHVMRPYDNLEERQAIEANHSPSIWRNNYGE